MRMHKISWRMTRYYYYYYYYLSCKHTHSVLARYTLILNFDALNLYVAAEISAPTTLSIAVFSPT